MAVSKAFWRPCALAILSFLVLAGSVAAQGFLARDDRLTFSLVGGRMTRNGIDEVFLPARVDFAANSFAGLVLGYERPLGNRRWQIGVEVQANHHFRHDEYQEFVVPVTLRYSPARPWPPVFDSVALGLGFSYATETPRLEVAMRGDSQRALLYLLLEAAFAVGDGGDTVFFRLHHRSDAYGLFATDSGSNAFAVGYRIGF